MNTSSSDGDSFRVGIVGSGNAGAKLHLPVLDAMPGVSVEWICDLDLPKAKAVADQFSVPSYSDELNRCTDVDAIVLTIPVGSRNSVIETALERHWHFLVENPFAKSVAEHQNILEQAKSAGVQVGVMAQRRGYHGTLVARKILRSGILGRVRRVWAADSDTVRRSGIDGDTWISRLVDPTTSSGGFLEETGWHLIDHVFYLVNADDVTILNAELNGIDGVDTDIRVESKVTTDSDESFNLAVRLTRSKEIRRGISVECERGTIVIGNCPRDVVTLASPDGEHICDLNAEIKSAKSGYAAVHYHWEGFIDQCRTSQPSVSSAENTILTTKFIEQVFEQGVWES